MVEASTFLAAWGAFFAGHISLRKLPSSVKKNLKSEIDSFNSSHGLRQSIDVEEITIEYLRPFKTSKTAEYCNNEDKQLDEYLKDLEKDVGSTLFNGVRYYLYYLSSLVFFPGVFILLMWGKYHLSYLGLCMVFVATELFFFLTE